MKSILNTRLKHIRMHLYKLWFISKNRVSQTEVADTKK